MANDDYKLDDELQESQLRSDVELLKAFLDYHGSILEILLEQANLTSDKRLHAATLRMIHNLDTLSK